MADVNDTVSSLMEGAAEAESRFNMRVAALAAILATLLGVFNVKDGNIAQSMAQHQAHAVDSWAHYQFKNVKQHLAENMVDSLTLEQAKGNPSAEYRLLLTEKIAHFQSEGQRYGREKEEIRVRAEGHEKEYEALNFRDDQFDMAEAGIEIAIALLSISVLTRRRWLFGVALVFAGFGIATGLSGFFGWSFHPDLVAQWLS
ncbi:MAG: DUF4337 domain-containing protein [Magnetococcales bacterium]|nr:DUF4337 domain-containing protein [Magnetococcales bacterium]NGZ06752.1 DUF4337 domain-containing protein [Magnetococcales bacterium]